MTNRSGGRAFCLDVHRLHLSQVQEQGQVGSGAGSSVWNSTNRASLSSRSLRLYTFPASVCVVVESMIL
jgi:hypothetical protein